jgi:Spy/CpxP family protein refolding chaperone
MKRTHLGLIGLVLVLAATLIMPALAQQPGGGGGGNGGGNGGGRGGNFDPAQFRQRMLDSIKSDLAASDDDWKTLSPAIEKVMTLQRDSMRGMFGGRGGRNRGGDNAPANPPAADAQPASPVATASKALQDTLDNKDAKPEEIKAKLAALREARAKAREDLAKARKDLTELLTQRQEAVLVQRGILE